MKNDYMQIKVRGEHDRRSQALMRKKQKNLAFWQRVSLFYNPIIALTFVFIYWIVGLKHAGAI